MYTIYIVQACLLRFVRCDFPAGVMAIHTRNRQCKHALCGLTAIPVEPHCDKLEIFQSCLKFIAIYCDFLERCERNTTMLPSDGKGRHLNQLSSMKDIKMIHFHAVFKTYIAHAGKSTINAVN